MLARCVTLLVRTQHTAPPRFTTDLYHLSRHQWAQLTRRCDGPWTNKGLRAAGACFWEGEGSGAYQYIAYWSK